MSSGKRVVVTGGTGYLGSRVVWDLASDPSVGEVVCVTHGCSGTEAVRLDRFGPAVESGKVGIVPIGGDPFDGLRGVLRGADAVIHLAALYDTGYSPDAVERIATSNLTLSCALFSTTLAEAPSARLVMAGTMSSFDGDGSYAPANVYAASKKAMEDVAAGFHGLDAVTLRLPDTYGERDHRGKVMNLLTDALLAGKPFRFMKSAAQELSLLHVVDASRAFRDAVLGDMHPSGREYSLVSRGWHVKLVEMALMVGRHISGIAPSLCDVSFGNEPTTALPDAGPAPDDWLDRSVSSDAWPVWFERIGPYVADRIDIARRTGRPLRPDLAGGDAGEPAGER